MERILALQRRTEAGPTPTTALENDPRGHRLSLLASSTPRHDPLAATSVHIMKLIATGNAHKLGRSGHAGGPASLWSA